MREKEGYSFQGKAPGPPLIPYFTPVPTGSKHAFQMKENSMVNLSLIAEEEWDMDSSGAHLH